MTKIVEQYPSHRQKIVKKSYVYIAIGRGKKTGLLCPTVEMYISYLKIHFIPKDTNVIHKYQIQYQTSDALIL